MRIVINDLHAYMITKELEKKYGNGKDYTLCGQISIDLVTDNLEVEFTYLNKEESLEVKRIIQKSEGFKSL